MIDDKTPHLQLPLPHEANLLEEDVHRLRAALNALDGLLASEDPALGSLGELAEAVKLSQAAITTLESAVPEHDANVAAHPALGARLGAVEAEFPLREFSGLITEKMQDLGAISGSVLIEPSAGHYVLARVSGALTLNIADTVPEGCTTLLLELLNGGQYVVQWGMQPRWTNGLAPVLTPNGTDLILLCNRGAGWLGVLAASNVR